MLLYTDSPGFWKLSVDAPESKAIPYLRLAFTGDDELVEATP